ncbi:Sina domain-containing protein [Cephalotus follicularis]|uniref:RING-type E3 ubiquitin transferase n=1 Tax=Cephalotus follicularis TaxID=3775 RepID=A0A1Q3C6V5_CEPFO|nr:Sina domain-containing protein [Cephalotus follicularis]
MARFSVGGEGTSRSQPQRFKRHRTNPSALTVVREPQPPVYTFEEDEEEEDEDDDYEGDGVEEYVDDDDAPIVFRFHVDRSSNDEEGQQQQQEPQTQQHSLPDGATPVVPGSPNAGVAGDDSVSEKVGPTNGGSISVTLTDPDVLDCCICYETLTVPVFQCDNGHIACSSCCTKLGNKCSICSLPIGYSRCRAIEKVLESVKVSCQNAKYGCPKHIFFSRKYDHEKTCICAPCSCPLTDCDFIGSFEQLCEHFRIIHRNPPIPFVYDRMLPLVLNTDSKFCVMMEEKDCILFILIINQIELIGIESKVVCIAPPCSSRVFYYYIVTKSRGSSLIFQSCIKSMKAWVNDPLAPSLLVPSSFALSGGKFQLEVCIGRDGVLGRHHAHQE